jgi:hypothetical protein
VARVATAGKVRGVYAPPGQTAIRLRERLIAGEAAGAAALVAGLDEDHRLEVLLGAALRDAREGHAAAAAYLAAEATGRLDAATWLPLCERLTAPPDDHLDALAAAWTASAALPERWRPGGRALAPAEAAALRAAASADTTLVALVAAGVGGEALLAAFAGRPLHRAVARYYAGRIRALGWRPLLVLTLA